MAHDEYSTSAQGERQDALEGLGRTHDSKQAEAIHEHLQLAVVTDTSHITRFEVLLALREVQLGLRSYLSYHAILMQWARQYVPE